MNIEELQRFIDEEDRLLCSVKGTNQNERDRIYVRTIKLGEEFGELCDQVLASVGDQRKDKLAKKSADSLNDEFADVLIVTFLLAKSMHVDIMQALDHKVKKIKEKHNQQL